MDVLLPEDRIRERVNALASAVNADLAGKPFVVVGILTGSLVFLADLIRRIRHPHQIGLIQASSYRDGVTAGTLVVNESLLPDVTGKHVLLLDDILDTGQTLARLVELLHRKGAAGVKTCVLLRKIGRQTIAVEPDYTGFEIPNEFVVGYGLDYAGDYRHLPFIGVLPEADHP
jgi:hypoxanthine phosphoribosyltransferase